jgi:hypothetical protein
MDLATALDELRAAPLEDFVPERKRLAGELRAAGDRTGAAQLLKVPKPSAADWALAAVVREDPGAVDAWLEVATELREASTRPGEVGGDAVRAAMAAHRTATAKLVGLVRERGGLTEAMTDRVRSALQLATTDAEAAEALRAGHPPGMPSSEAGGGIPAGAAVPSRSSAPAGSAGGARAADAAHEARAKARREAEAAAERERSAEFARKMAEARTEVERLREEAARTAAAASAADEALEDARRALHRRESEAAAAHDAAAEAAEAAAEARRAVDALRHMR